MGHGKKQKILDGYGKLQQAVMSHVGTFLFMLYLQK